MPRSRMRRANSRTMGKGLRKTSSPKFSDPAFSVAISGRQSSGCARSSALIPTAPPVEVCTITSQRDRMARIALSNKPRSCVGLPSSLRTCKWMTEAPAAAQRSASAASSSAGMGRYGVCSRVVSAPQIAAVRMAGTCGIRPSYRLVARREARRSMRERGAFLHFLDGATHVAFVVALGEIAQADDADRLSGLIGDEHARDLPVLHEVRDLPEVLVGPHADDVLGHHLLDPSVFHVTALGDEAHDDVAVVMVPTALPDWSTTGKKPMSSSAILRATSWMVASRLTVVTFFFTKSWTRMVVSGLEGTPRNMRTAPVSCQRRPERCLPAGTPQVPTARHTTTGGCSTAAA